MAAFLEVQDLSIAIAKHNTLDWVVKELSFDLQKGQTLAVLGKSGVL